MALEVKNSPANAGDIRHMCLIPGLGRSLEKEMATHSNFLAGESCGQKSLEGYSFMWSQSRTQRKQLSMHSRQKHLHTHFERLVLS